MSDNPGTLRLLRRDGCSLCQEMAEDLSRLGIDFQEIDVAQDEALESAYGDAIPVLLIGDREIARAPQTERSLRDALIRAGCLPAVR